MRSLSVCSRVRALRGCAGWLLVIVLAVPTALQSQVSSETSRRVHAPLFSANSTDTIPALLAKGNSDLTVARFENSGLQPAMPETPGQPLFRIRSLTCQSNLVVIATAVSGQSHMTADKTFFYTDWNFVVDDVLKDNSKAPVRSAQTITIVRPGGEVVLEGRRVYAIDKNFTDFRDGKQYLLYLEYISTSKSYRASQDNSFSISGSNLTHLSANGLFPEVDRLPLDRVRQDTLASAGLQAGSQCAEEEGQQ
jgi:hypothetical protein